jgi:uncharacterized protein (DUF58 family)
VIYPTARAVALAALGAPLALVLGLVAPGLWVAGAGWAAFVFGLLCLDAVLAADRRALETTVETPTALAVSRPAEARVRAAFERGPAPGGTELSLETGAKLSAQPERLKADPGGRRLDAAFALHALRRGEGRLERLWLRWRGPLGLVWKQRTERLDRALPINPDVQAVREEAVRLFSRETLFGMKAQLETGDGSEFHALREHLPGMDLRRIDWKQSARHAKLLAREFRTERNHQVVLALDTGRLMCEPLGGVPRIDRAVDAALLLAYVGLKTGDRIGLFAFDARPRLQAPAVAGVAAFPVVQRQLARVDYSAEETNFTLGLTTLAHALERRSLVVVFTDFADPTGAELMLETVGRLTKRHLVVFVVFQDAELEALARAEPLTADDVSRAVVAGALLRERQLVVARLRRLGVEIVEAPLDRVGAELISRYLDLKRKDRL